MTSPSSAALPSGTSYSAAAPPPPSGAVVSGAVAALQRVLAAEHAAVYAYSVIGVHLAEQSQVERARALQERHRSVRDQVSAQIAARNATPQPAAASYTPDRPVTDPTSAQRWALSIELDCAAGYREQLSASASDADPTAERAAALVGLTDSAKNAFYWRSLLTPASPTTAFPGLS